MSLRRVTDRYHSDVEGAQRRAKGLLQWVIDHIDKLAAVTTRRPYVVENARRLHADIKKGHLLDPKELSDIDEMYELVMKAHGLPSVPRHHDLIRR